MGSMSKCYEDNYSREKYDYKKQEKQCTTIIKCSNPTSTTIPPATAIGTIFTVATLNLNTACLCDPCVKLEFASNIDIPSIRGIFNISFQVFKQCRNQLAPVAIGPAWNFVVPVVGATTNFSFFVCDCGDGCYDECCIYTVVARVNATTPALLPAHHINNAILGAVATSGNSCSKKCH